MRSKMAPLHLGTALSLATFVLYGLAAAFFVSRVIVRPVTHSQRIKYNVSRKKSSTRLYKESNPNFMILSKNWRRRLDM